MGKYSSFFVAPTDNILHVLASFVKHSLVKETPPSNFKPKMTSSRRTSSELASTVPSETKQRTSQLRISKSVIAHLQKVAEQEEKELFLYSLREELINRVMNVIYKRYLEKQCVKFTVDCAYKALVQILKIEFLIHDKVNNNLRKGRLFF